jgi:hypothetical protein
MPEIPQIVRQRMALAKAADAHPDANLLNAFAENGLQAGEREGVLAHLSVCGDCRTIAALAKPEIEETQAVIAVSGGRGWRHSPAFRLGLGVVCVAIVGSGITSHYFGSAFRRESESRASGVSLRASGSGAAAAPAEAVSKAATESLKEDGRSQVAAALAAPSRKKVPIDTMALALIPGRAKAATEQSTTADAAGNFTSNAPMAEAKVSAAAPAALSLQTSLLTPRWTLSSDGSVQRSFDAGKSWETIVVAENQNFLAITAFEQSVWLGGTDGVLFHSADAGQHWSQVKPAADGEALSDDIIGVEFSDALHGRVTTASGTWTTEDAGLNWQRF